MTVPTRGTLIVEFAEERHTLTTSDTFTIGRRADLVVDESNRLLHRVLAELAHTPGGWTLRNAGRTIALVVTDLDGASFARIAPGAQIIVPFARASVTFSAGRANYRIDLSQDVAGETDIAPTLDLPDGYERAERTMTATTVVFNDDQFELLSALARRRLGGPVSAADLPSNRQLADELGWTPSKLVRKLDHLCAKLHRAGIEGLVGTAAASADDRRVRLADVAVEHGLVTRTDLDRASGDPTASPGTTTR